MNRRGRASFGRWPVVVSALLAVMAWAVPVFGNHVVMHRGPFGGVVVHLLPDPDDAGTLYLASFGSGVYKSVDGGRRWVPVSHGLEDALTVLTLAMDPVDPRVLYAGTDAGLFVSLDGGGRWVRRGPAIADRNIRSLVVIPTRPTVLFAATDQGVLWSWNQGATWAPRDAGLGLRDIRVLRLDPARPGWIFAAGFGGVFRSDDDGRRWRAVNRGLTDLRVRVLALDPTRPDVVYAGTAGGGVFVTGDGGGQWTPLNEGLRNLTVLSLLVTPGGERFAGTVGGVYRREASASAWELVGADVLTLTVTFVAANPHRPGTLYAGTGGLVFVSEDQGRRWRELAVTVAGGVAPQPLSVGLDHPVAGHSHKERR
ncbi:MAG: hypothetical protein HY726_02095 [Candidatus Rokubacteria bacterium]|nr:hypothetical protein [Candidatus Rokubacteria bacterium]